jgi:hypothetical protein
MLYEEDIVDIYKGTRDIVDLVDNDNKTQFVLTNLKDHLADDCLNIVHKDYQDIIDTQENKVIDNYLDLQLTDTYDEIMVFDILSTLELNEYEDHLSHWVSFLNDNGTIYITDICLDNIFKMFFTPNEFNGNEITDNTIKMAISCLYGNKNYKRRSIIVPSILAEILNNVGIKNVAMKSQNTKAIIKGTLLRGE